MKSAYNPIIASNAIDLLKTGEKVNNNKDDN
jgi:hypothetical protein